MPHLYCQRNLIASTLHGIIWWSIPGSTHFLILLIFRRNHATPDLGKLQVTLRIKTAEIIWKKLYQMHMCSDNTEEELAHDLWLNARCSYGFYVTPSHALSWLIIMLIPIDSSSYNTGQQKMYSLTRATKYTQL